LSDAPVLGKARETDEPAVFWRCFVSLFRLGRQTRTYLGCDRDSSWRRATRRAEDQTSC